MSESAYRTWRTYTAKVGGRSYEVATKPGAFAQGRLDPAALLLAEHAKVASGDTVVHLNCGNGLAAAVSALAAPDVRVYLTDRNVVSVEASRRTLDANRVTTGDVFLAHGTNVLPTGLSADSVIIRIPPERLALLQLLVDASSILKPGGRCYIAGANNEGIKSAAGTIETLFGNARVLARDSSHRVISAVKRTAEYTLPDGVDVAILDSRNFREVDATLRGRRYRLCSRPGVFSWEHVDEATSILADVMEIHEGNSVLDLGCGAGALGMVASSLSTGGPITMVDADVEAVRSATRSAEVNGIESWRALASDVAGSVLGERFDVVVTNPPFHVGKPTDLDVPMQFISDAHDVLVPDGRMFLVANRTLPYEQAIKHRFGNVANLHDGPRFKVLTATRAAG
ncbi:class I SAM-dependent methyltransferase [soil metagenome]